MPRGMAIFFARKQRSRRLRKNGLLLILPQKRAGLQFLSHIFAGANGPGAERMSPSFQRERKRDGDRRCTTQAPTPPGALRGRRTEGTRRFFFALNRKSNKFLHIFHFLLVHDIQIMYTYYVANIFPAIDLYHHPGRQTRRSGEGRHSWKRERVSNPTSDF